MLMFVVKYAVLIVFQTNVLPGTSDKVAQFIMSVWEFTFD